MSHVSLSSIEFLSEIEGWLSFNQAPSAEEFALMRSDIRHHIANTKTNNQMGDDSIIDGMREDITRLVAMLRRSQNCINHARKWIKNMNPEYADKGTYRHVSEQIDILLGEFAGIQIDDDKHI